MYEGGEPKKKLRARREDKRGVLAKQQGASGWEKSGLICLYVVSKKAPRLNRDEK
jgi:hypothetical protein